MFADQRMVTHFNNTKAHTSLAANVFPVTSHTETKQLTEMPPSILGHLSVNKLNWQKLDGKAPLAIGKEGDNFRILMRLPTTRQVELNFFFKNNKPSRILTALKFFV